MNGWHRKTNDAAAQARTAQYRSREHRELRAIAKAEVDAGRACCWRCGSWLPPGSAFHLGHDDNDRTVYRGVEHPGCNLRAAARKGARVANGLRRVTVTALRM